MIRAKSNKTGVNLHAMFCLAMQISFNNLHIGYKISKPILGFAHNLNKVQMYWYVCGKVKMYTKVKAGLYSMIMCVITVKFA